MKRTVIAAGLLLLGASGSALAKEKPGPPEPVSPPDWADVRAKSEAAVRARLVDPDSARIEWQRGFKWGGYKPFLSKRVFGYAGCGVVNAKNRMGGYTGSTAFVVVYDAGQVKYVELDDESLQLVAMQCAKASLPPSPPEFSTVPVSTSLTPPLSIADEIAKLVSLRDRGILTNAEFESQKAKLLAR